VINITKSKIQALLTGYETRITKNKKRSPFRNLTGRLPDIIDKLNKFVATLNLPETDQLTSPQLYELLTLLLKRKIRKNLLSGEATLSEVLAQEIEEKFEKPRMDCFRACSELNYLNQAVFDFICEINDFQALPKDAELLEWLRAKKLIADTEPAITQLETTHELSSYLSTKDLASASQVSQGFRGLFKPALDTKRLCQYVVYGDLKNAEQIIISNPGILTRAATVTDYSGRQVHGTALQLALGAKDVRFHEKERAMVEMITEVLLSAFPNGETIRAQQVCAQFPAGWEAAYQARVERDQAALGAFVAAIARSNNPVDWETAAVVYREHFDHENKGRGVIKTGFHTNELAVAAWFQAYNDNFVAFGNEWDSPKNRFLWQKGSYCERYLTACGAMALARDVWKIVKDGMHLDRSLAFLYGGGSFFPLDSDPAFRLGYDCAGRAGRVWGSMHVDAGPRRPLFQNYVGQKTSTLHGLMQECRSNLETKQHPSK
jgi:hypothetical protein